MNQRNDPATRPPTPRYRRERIEKGITRRTRTDGSGTATYDVQVWVNRSARSKTFASLAAARRWRDEMLGERAQGRPLVAPDRKTTVADFVRTAWDPRLDEEIQLGNLRPSTVGWYRTGAKTVVREIGRTRLADVGKRVLRGLLSRRIATGDSNAKLKHLRATTRSILSLAVERDLLRSDPSDFMVGRNAPKALRSATSGPKAWSQTEARHFLGSIEGDDLEALWVLLLGSGLRRGRPWPCAGQTSTSTGRAFLSNDHWCRSMECPRCRFRSPRGQFVR